MLRRCASIVRGLSTSCSATSRLVRPAATSAAISCSRPVSAAERARRAARGARDAVAEPAQLAHRLVAPAQRRRSRERRLGVASAAQRGGARSPGGRKRPALGEQRAAAAASGAPAAAARRGGRGRLAPASPSARRTAARGVPTTAPPTACRLARRRPAQGPRAAATSPAREQRLDQVGRRAGPRREDAGSRAAERRQHARDGALGVAGGGQRGAEAPAGLAGAWKARLGAELRRSSASRSAPVTSPAASRAGRARCCAHSSICGLPPSRARVEPSSAGGDRLGQAAELAQRRDRLDA